MKALIAIVTASMFLAAVPGCRTGSGPYRPASESRRETSRAEKLTREAAEMMDDEPQEAEGRLREALTADLYHGPAHNNLGVLFLNRGDLYEAASEFEWARKLMPGHPDPRTNLAITLERAGRFDDAMDAYRTAIEIRPGDLAAIQGLTRLEVSLDRVEEPTRERLQMIAQRSTDEQWRSWARRELLRGPDADTLP